MCGRECAIHAKVAKMQVIIIGPYRVITGYLGLYKDRKGYKEFRRVM